ncbi:MAG TPA: uroporphyrinogen-III C-methyltransferase [Rhodocyclaceae bacterium]|nr:uroporphyrinogen-III C-methyltransferase [Rhodocyclaceae bacterium]
MSDAMTDPDTPTEIIATPIRTPSAPAWRNPWLIVALAAIGLAGWQWVENRQTQQEVAARLAQSDAADKEGRDALKQAQEQLAALQARVGGVEAKQAEFQGQAQELQNLYQDLALSRDDALLLEVEQAITLAAQQLQLAGNVPAAVLALQTADAKLARLDRPQVIALRKTLTKDLDRLRSLPSVDVPGLSLRLENAIVAADKLPLAMDGRPRAPEKAAAAKTAPEAPAAWWRRAGEAFWQEVRGLVRIQRFDKNEPVLLAPEQSFFLRENLKLRLLNARLALFVRDTATYRNELKAVQDMLASYYDGQDKTVQATQASLKQLAAADVGMELPNLNDSLAALRSLRGGKEKK